MTQLPEGKQPALRVMPMPSDANQNGDFVELEKIGTTSITVTVEVYAERRPENPCVVKVTEATLTYVAIDSAGRPRAVPRS